MCRLVLDANRGHFVYEFQGLVIFRQSSEQSFWGGYYRRSEAYDLVNPPDDDLATNEIQTFLF